MMNSLTRNTFLLLGLLLADQITKAVVLAARPEFTAGIFSLNILTNTGAGFGILQGKNTLLIFISLIVLGIIMMNIKQVEKRQELPVVLLVAGLLGNLIDRLFRGYVVDFIDLTIWPVFNIADSLIFISVLWLAKIIIFDKNSFRTAANNKNKKAKK